MDEPIQAPPQAMEPIRPRERIVTLDVLRGFALFGILFVNVTAMSQPTDWFGVAWSEISPLDSAVEIFKLFFVQGKFYTLFAFLFGLGFAVQLDRAEARGQRFAVRFLWRMLLLFLIGLVHLVLIWEGDILNAYAIGGVFLLLFLGLKRLLDKLVRRASKGRREKAPRGLALVLAGVLMFGPLLAFAGMMSYAFGVRDAARAGQELSGFEQGIWEQLEAVENPERQAERDQEKADELAIFADGTFADTLAYRIEHAPERIFVGPFWLIVAGIFVIGAYFGRHDFIGRAPELRRGFRRLLGLSLAVGIPLSAIFVYVEMAKAGHSGVTWFDLMSFLFKTASGLALALAYVAAISLLMETGARRWLLPLAPTGRMALTNYLAQSVVGTAVFYGWGLGLLGRLGSASQLVYIVVIFGLQIVFSQWWLSRFRFGPVEWLWRSLTYLKLQPMRARPQG